MTIRTGVPDADAEFDVCVIGSGPAGLATAFACDARGLSTIVLEAGGPRPSLSRSAERIAIKDEALHASLDGATREALGGTSWVWGGLCVPFERSDFSEQPRMPPWPIAYEEMARWHGLAAEFLDCGEPFADDTPAWAAEAGLVTRIGRLARRPELGLVNADRLEASRRITLCLHAAAIDLVGASGGQSIIGVNVSDHTGLKTRVRARRYVLAGGGLRSTRLLLLLGRDWPRHFAVGTAPLGRFYMGHLTGEIGTIVFHDPSEAGWYLYRRDRNGFYVQRRVHLSPDLLRGEPLLNTAFTLRSPPPGDSRHQDGVASLIVLLSSPRFMTRFVHSDRLRKAVADYGSRDIPGHLGNVFRRPWATLSHGFDAALRSRVRHLPLITENVSGRYSLRYHSEQWPLADSRVFLSGEENAGMTVDFRYSDADIRSVVRSHELLDAALRQSGRGHLEYFDAPERREDAVRAQASDGYHQVGLTRMGTDPAGSIVDAACRVHGFANLFVASSSVFPRTGSANPTFPTVAFALRLGHHLADLVARERPDVTTAARINLRD